MSPFMSSMPPAGFMEMPPVSKHTPLPTKQSVLARFDLAPCQLRHDDARGTPAALTDREQRLHVEGLELFLLEHLDLGGHCLPDRAMRSARLDGPRSRLAGSLTRSAGQEDAVGKGLAGERTPCLRRLRTVAQDLELAEARRRRSASAPSSRLAARRVFLEGGSFAKSAPSARSAAKPSTPTSPGSAGSQMSVALSHACAHWLAAEGMAAQQQPINSLPGRPEPPRRGAAPRARRGAKQLDCGLLLPLKPAAAAARSSAPLARSLRARAVAPSASSSPASKMRCRWAPATRARMNFNSFGHQHSLCVWVASRRRAHRGARASMGG